MATRNELIDDIISLTSPRDDLISTNDVDSLMSIAEDEIQTKVEGEVGFFPASESGNSQRALFWLTCLFVKVKTGEVEASETTINDLQTAPLRAESGDDVVWWLSKFRTYLSELQSEVDNEPSGFGVGKISRTNRRYGSNSLYYDKIGNRY